MPPYLASIPDPPGEDGSVRVADGPGLGYRIDTDYVEATRIDRG